VALEGYGLNIVGERPAKSDRLEDKVLNMAKFLIVEARFYDHLNDMLVAGRRRRSSHAGHKVEVLTVPGALEIPGAIALAAESEQFDGYVAIGVVIRGETYHFEIVAGESARGIMALTMDGIAIGNGILTVENEEQALVRADPAQKDKGGEAAKAALALLALKSRFEG
jgi:6,7-dimethyl-8-ribityllumazine synthase